MTTALATRPPADLATLGEKAIIIPDSPHRQNPWPIALSVVDATIAQLELPEEEGAELRWLRDFGYRNAKTIGEVAKLIDYNGNTVYKILTGKHEARLDNFIAEVRAFRAKIEKTATKGFPFTQTETGERINTICDLAISSGRILFLVGRSHCGKTVNLVEYPKRHAYGLVHTVRTNAGAQAHQFKMRLGNVLGISNAYRAGDLSERIIDALQKVKLLNIDEYQECAPDGEKPRAKTITFIRELHDMTGTPLVLAMHEEAFERMQERRHAQLFKPLLNRALDPFYLEAEPTVADRNAYAATLGLPPATGAARDLQSTIITNKSLGSWLLLLQLGQKKAANHKEPFTWDHVLRADATFAKQKRKS